MPQVRQGAAIGCLGIARLEQQLEDCFALTCYDRGLPKSAATTMLHNLCVF